MRIAISTSVIQRGQSGVGQYVLALTKALLRYTANHQFFLFVLKDDVPLFDFAAGWMRIIPVEEKWRSPIKNIIWHHTVLPGLLKKYNLDVLHVPSYRRMISKAPCALVATIHDLAPFHMRGKYDLARTLYGKHVAKRFALKQNAILAVSTNTAEDIEHFFGIPVTDQQVILNGLDHSRFNPGHREFAAYDAANHWQLDRPYFLYVSRLEHPAKNHVRLIEAFNQFKQLTGLPHILALGGADWHGSEFIRATAQASPYAQDIRFLGFIPDASLPNLYRAAAAMVYPSLFEGFGMPPVEAMACGCPVISSTKGSLGEVVRSAALTIDPEKIESIRDALYFVTSSESFRNRLIELGYANVKRFSWDLNAEQVMRAYQEVILERYPNSERSVAPAVISQAVETSQAVEAPALHH
jgi:glycosyltransferase involved in cell wall biosynthesis